MTHNIEESNVLQLDFNKLAALAKTDMAVIPVAVQHYHTKDILIIGYMNEEALQETQSSGQLTLWSTSRNELWKKGSTSGDILEVNEIRVNCEQNSLVCLVKPLGKGVCHTQNSAGKTRQSCYYRLLEGPHLDNQDL